MTGNARLDRLVVGIVASVVVSLLLGWLVSCSTPARPAAPAGNAAATGRFTEPPAGGSAGYLAYRTASGTAEVWLAQNGYVGSNLESWSDTGTAYVFYYAAPGISLPGIPAAPGIVLSVEKGTQAVTRLR